MEVDGVHSFTKQVPYSFLKKTGSQIVDDCIVVLSI